MLLAEEALLQVTDDEGKNTVGTDNSNIMLAGGLLAELAIAGRITVDEKKRLRTLSTQPVGDPMLDEALGRFAEKAGKKAKDALGPVAKKRTEQVYRRLAAAGLVREQEHRTLGIFPGTRWPLTDVMGRNRVRAELAGVVTGSLGPDARTVTLLGLLDAVDANKLLVEATGMSARKIRTRTRDLAKGEWAPEAVRRAIADASAAIGAAVAASAAAVAATSAS